MKIVANIDTWSPREWLLKLSGSVPCLYKLSLLWPSLRPASWTAILEVFSYTLSRSHMRHYPLTIDPLHHNSNSAQMSFFVIISCRSHRQMCLPVCFRNSCNSFSSLPPLWTCHAFMLIWMIMFEGYAQEHNVFYSPHICLLQYTVTLWLQGGCTILTLRQGWDVFAWRELLCNFLRVPCFILISCRF